MKIKKNPTAVLNAKVTFFGKRGFSSMAKATKFSIKLPWMRKARTFDIEVKGRRTKKKVLQVVLDTIHIFEVERSQRLAKAESKRAATRPISTARFDPFDFTVKYREETFYSKTIQSFIQANKIRYSYKSRQQFTESNFMSVLKPLYKVVKMAAQDFVFEQSGYDDYLQIKLDFMGDYLNRRRSNKSESMSFSLPRIPVRDPDDIDTYVLSLFKDFTDRLRVKDPSLNYFRIKLMTEKYFLAGFTLERVFKVEAV